MTSEQICPACETPVVPAGGIYRIGDNDYHWECCEHRQCDENQECYKRKASDQRQVASMMAAEPTSHHRGLGGRPWDVTPMRGTR
jgi:hypothetical protein